MRFDPKQDDLRAKLRIKVRKARLLSSRLVTHPLEGLDLIGGDLAMLRDRVFGRQMRYKTLPSRQVLTDIAEYLEADASELSREASLRRLSSEVGERLEGLQGRAPFDLAFNADADLAMCCYLVCRLLKPLSVIETGIALGLTSAYILQALQTNERGTLHSVDLPPLSSRDGFVGYLVPQRLESRWRRHRGASRRILPRLFRTVDDLEVFVHDSLHSRANMRWELGAAYRHLRAGGAIVADDIDSNDAFYQIESEFRFSRVAAASTTFGVGIK